MRIALLTGGKDEHYASGLLRELLTRGVDVVCIGNDHLADRPLAGIGHLEFRNLVGSLDRNDGITAKAWRVLKYYAALVLFAACTDARLFHILWFRKFPKIERTVLTAYLKVLGKTLIFTAHNVDGEARDGRRPRLANRLSLKFLYRAVDHVLVHTAKMKRELVEEFDIPEHKVTIVPYGINDAVPVPVVSRSAAKRQMGFAARERVLLFFGHIAPYKGVEDLIRALAVVVREERRFTLVVAGRPRDKSCEPYWRDVEALIDELRLGDYVRKEIRYIPDEEAGLLFRASDVSVLPYRRIYQSGVLALSYAQGVPVIVADVGSLSEDVIEGETGLVFRPGDVRDLSVKIRTYFASDLFKNLETRGEKIRAHGAERFSWARNGDLTCAAYARLLGK